MPLRVDECAVDTRAVRIDRIEDTEKLFGEWLRASWPMLRCKFDGPLAVTDIVRKSTDLLVCDERNRGNVQSKGYHDTVAAARRRDCDAAIVLNHVEPDTLRRRARSAALR